MELKADLVQGEIPRVLILEDGQRRLNPKFPHSGACKTGHWWVPPQTTRFFEVVGPVLSEEQSGIYCEFCLIVSNEIKALNKANKPIEFDPLAKIRKMVENAWEKSEQSNG